MDQNGSGQIDFNEFKSAMSNKYLKQLDLQELKLIFNKYDYDQNGFITMDEFQRIMSNMGRHMNINEIKSMIHSLDSNQDGKISFEEFIQLF